MADITSVIGNTPLLEVKAFDTGCCRLFIKLEHMNPGGSMKDRVAKTMVDAAEKSGALTKGGHIVEGTAGNTGVSLAMVALPRGYQLTCVMPDKMNVSKVALLKRLGANVIRTVSDVEQGHPKHFLTMASELGQQTGWLFIDQFNNRANTLAHFQGTGPEIYQQLSGKIDTFVFGAGTGATISGVGAYLQQQNSNIDIVLADPEGSVLANSIDGRPVKDENWLSEGIGSSFVPSLFNGDVINQALTFSNKDILDTLDVLIKQCGVFAGPSSAGCVSAAVKYCRQQTRAKNVVTIIADNGYRYLNS